MAIRNDYTKKPQSPPAFVPEIQYPTPNINDVVIVEDVPMTKAGYRPLPYGTPRHNDTTAVLVWQGAVKGSNNEVVHRRIYATSRNAQDAYNAATQYVSDDASSPIYIRQYIEPRDTYTRATDLSSFTGIVRLAITAAGSGYTSAPTVSFSGGGGSGAAATAEIQAGAVVALLITNTGSGYTAAPTVTFSSGAATATAHIQPASAKLIKEETQPAPGEMASRFLSVTRVYQTLPGPILYQDAYDPQRGPVQRSTQLIAYSAVEASLTRSGQTVTETSYEPVSALVLRKTVETWGFGGAPTLTEQTWDERRGRVLTSKRLVPRGTLAKHLYFDGKITKGTITPVNALVDLRVLEEWTPGGDTPIVHQEVYDPRKGSVSMRSVYIHKTGSEDGTIENVSGVITEVSFKAVDDLTLDKTTETWVLADAPTLTEDVYDVRRGAIQRASQYIAAASLGGTLANSSGTITETTYSPVNNLVLDKVIETWVLADAPVLTEDVYDERRGAVQRVSQYIAAATVDGTLANSFGTITETTYKPVNSLVADKAIETWVLANAPTLTDEAWDTRKGRVTRAIKYVASGTASSYTIATNTLTEVTQKPVNSVIAQQTTETWDVSASPTVTQDIYDPRKGAVQVASQFIKSAGSEVGSVAHSGGTITEISYKPVDNLVLDKMTETWVISSAPALIKYDVDDEAVVNSTGRKAGVTITEQLILKPANFAELGNAEGTQVTYYSINDVYGNKISLALLDYASIGTRTEYKFGPYRYPPLVRDVTATGAEAKDGTVRTMLNWERRAGRSRNVQYKIEVTYGTQAAQEAARAALTIFDPALNDLIYAGVFFNVSHQGVLNDACTFSYTTGTTNQKWPYIVESVTFAASGLTAAAWVALEEANGNAGTEKTINAVLTPWKYNLWRLEVFKVTIKA
jgi:hypothetical protein